MCATPGSRWGPLLQLRRLLVFRRGWRFPRCQPARARVADDQLGCGMRLIVGTCRECAGTGNIPTDRFEETGELAHCHMCGGTGDLDSYRLMSAYEQGREDALSVARWALDQLQQIVNEPAAMTPSRLKQVVGGGLDRGTRRAA